MRRLYILLFHLFTVLLPAIGTNIERMDRLTTQDGLFSDRFFKSYRDKDGYLWILGINGVARYDGKHITNFEPTNDPSSRYIHGTRFYTIIHDKNNQIWIGGNDGLNLFDAENNTFKYFPIEINKDVRILENYKDSSIWVTCASEKNFLINIYNHKVTSRNEKFNITSTTTDRAGTKWLTTQSGLVLKDYQDTILQLEKGINDICFSPSGNLFVATSKGLLVYSEQSLKKKAKPSRIISSNWEGGWLSNRIVNTVEYNNGSVWVGTNNGLNRCILDENEFPVQIDDYYRDPNNQFSLSNNLINDIYLDHEGILWLATYGGLNKIDPAKKWFNSLQYDPEESNTLHDNYIFTIYGDPKSNIWMGNLTTGVSKYDSKKESFQWFHKDNSELKNNHIRQIYSDRQGDTWISTSHNICIYKDGNLLPIQITNSKRDLKGLVYSIIHHPDDYYWIGTRNNIYKLKRVGDTQFSVIEEFALDNARDIICFHIDHYQRIWIGTAKGLFLLDPMKDDQVFAFKKDKYPIFRSSTYQVINADSYGNLWLGSAEGVYVIKNDSTFRYKPENIELEGYFEEDGLTSNYVSGILPGSEGEMWLGSWKGLMKYNPKGKGIARFIPYSFEDGIVSEKFNRNGYYLDTLSDTYYFGSANGVNYFQLDKAIGREEIPNVLIHKVEVDGNEVDYLNDATDTNPGDSVIAEIKETGSIELLSVSFGSSSLLSPTKQVFAWMLEGRDEDWNYTRDRDIVIKGLSSGEYNLLIRSVSEDKGFGPSVIIRVQVVSLVMRTILILVAIFLFVGIALYFYRKNQPQSIPDNQEKKETEKKEKYVYSKLTTDKSSEIIEKLDQLMEVQKPYLNPDLTVDQLAELIGITSGKLSQVLNDFHQTRFYEYVNKYRVEEFVHCLENKEDESMTLQALSEKCGFASKSSFYRFFKSEKGTTPAQYAKSLKDGRSSKYES